MTAQLLPYTGLPPGGTPELPDPADVSRAAELLEHVLAAVTRTFQHLGVSVPDKRFVTVGQPVAEDCEMLAVSLVQVYSGPPGLQDSAPTHCASPHSAVVTVQLLRCAPLPNQRTGAVSAEKLTEFGLAQATDAWALLLSACQCDPWGTGYIADVSPTEPQGGYAGPAMNLVVAIP